MKVESQRLRNCPACGASAGEDRGEKNGFPIISCRNCGTLYASYLPDESNAQDYDDYYTPRNLSVPDFIQQRIEEIVAGFSSYRLQNHLLELGFGEGSLLRAAARAGWDVEGIEVSRTAVEYVRAYGLNAFCGELSDASYADASFDVVMASELLEHVTDPQRMLKEVARILRKGGLFWATTPNGRGMSARLLGIKWSVNSPPEHLHLFSSRGVAKLLTDAGFERVRIITHGVNPFEIWQALRKSARSNGNASACTGCERVESGYQLNEALMRSRSRRALKNMMNGLLKVSHLGDSLKIRAER